MRIDGKVVGQPGPAQVENRRTTRHASPGDPGQTITVGE